jgi:hypothetical protein
MHRALLFVGLFATALADESCVAPGTCTAPSAAAFSAVAPVTPRHQWPDKGGYCGSLSVQAIALSFGAWISEDGVRRAASGGCADGHSDDEHGEEIDTRNLGGALTNLQFEWDQVGSFALSPPTTVTSGWRHGSSGQPV